MKRIFIAFAIEDKSKRDHLVYQAELDHSPFEFVDMSVQKPWDEKWKTNCRARIEGCDGVVAIITKNTPKAEGQLWEIKCAFDEALPTMLMWGNDERPSLPALLSNKRISVWSWSNLTGFIDKL